MTEELMAEDLVPAQEAVLLTGLTDRALRKRVARGVLERFVDGEGRTCYRRDDLLAIQAETRRRRGASDAAAATEPSGPGPSREELMVALKEQEARFLRGQLEYIEQRLAESERAQSELRRLLLAYAPRLDRQDAFVVHPVAESCPERPWWQFWRPRASRCSR